MAWFLQCAFLRAGAVATLTLEMAGANGELTDLEVEATDLGVMDLGVTEMEMIAWQSSSCCW